MRITARTAAMVVAVVASMSAACISSYQSPRMLKSGHTSVTGAVSNVHHTEADEGLGETVDIVVNHAVSDKAEIIARYTDLRSLSGLVVGGKFGLVPDRLAVMVPVGPFWDAEDGYGGFVIQPELIWGVPASPNVEMTGAVKLAYVVPDEGDSDSYLGLDLGVRMSTDLSAWAFHPSIGVLDTPGDGMALSLGMALSFTH